MSEDVMKQHIDLYVNEFSLNLGKAGKQSITRLLDVYHELAGSNSNTTKEIFLAG
jgi:1,4-dihydroxy-6-naphthoate synthase